MIVDRPLSTLDRVVRSTHHWAAASPTCRFKAGRMSSLNVRPGWGGLNMALIIASMVILIVDQDGVAVFERKGQAPVTVYADRPVTSKTAMKGVPVPAGTIHVFGPCGRVQCRQLPGQARRVRGLDPRP